MRQKNGPKGNSQYKPIVPAVEQASRILLCLSERHHFKMNLTDICRQVGIYKGKGYSILHTLRQFGLVEKDLQTKTYFLGPNVIFLSRSVLDHLDYQERIAPFLETLARNTGATAAFGLIRGSHILVAAKRESNQSIGFSLGLGQRFHITLGAPGKVVAAFMNEKERKKLLSKKRLHFYGDPSHMDMKRLREEIEECRGRGYAQDAGEVTPGVAIVSAPVFNHQEEMIGCVFLIGGLGSGPIGEWGSRVAEAARQASIKFGACPERVYPERSVFAWHGVETGT
jgi:DNA-binding IclR family transcriptional regulator